MFRFLFVFFLSLSLTSQAIAAVKWNNNGGKTGSIIISKEARKISDGFKFKEIGQVAVNTEQRKSSANNLNLFGRCGGASVTFPPGIINDVNAPDGYGLDERFNKVSKFFRNASAGCLGGNTSMCKVIHNHALDYATNSRIEKPRGSENDALYWNDTLSVSMRLTGPMATALGVAWNTMYFPANERAAIMQWLTKIGNSFEHSSRDKGKYKLSKHGFVARKAGHNHATQSSISQMSIAALNGNKEKFMMGIDQWFITLDTMRKDGSLPIETRRGARAMFYHGRTLSALFAIAKRAEVQGIDLLGIERKKSIHKAVGFYLDVAKDPNLVLKYAKKNFAPGPNKDYTFQDIGNASKFHSNGQGWVRLYIERFPEHVNTKRLLNLNAEDSHISEALGISTLQRGKSSEWITVNTECFYTNN